jgi:hypothetical protein
VIYGWHELDKYGWIPISARPIGGNSWVAAHMGFKEKRALRDTLDGNFPTLVKKYGGENGNLRTMLKGSDAAFEKVEKEFLGDVEDVVKGHMAKINPPKEASKQKKGKKKGL